MQSENHTIIWRLSLLYGLNNLDKGHDSCALKTEQLLQKMPVSDGKANTYIVYSKSIENQERIQNMLGLIMRK